jgi:hypothetical protein
MLQQVYKPLKAGLVILLILQPRVSSQKDKQLEISSSSTQRLLKCDDARVVYTPFDKTYSKRIIFKSVTDTEDPPQNARKEYSPERNMWMAAVEPDTSKPGPWNTSIYFGSNSNEEVWKLTFVDQQGAGVKWLSEKLVFGQDWWGRIYATEFVLDIQQHKFIYMEMANYGATTEPCE